jgi:hypothetical protein
MAKERPRSTDGVEFLSESFYDADGNPVDDPNDAVSGEVTVRYPDGTIAHHKLVNGAKMNEEAEAPEEPITVTAPARATKKAVAKGRRIRRR